VRNLISYDLGKFRTSCVLFCVYW